MPELHRTGIDQRSALPGIEQDHFHRFVDEGDVGPEIGSVGRVDLRNAERQERIEFREELQVILKRLGHVRVHGQKHVLVVLRRPWAA